MERSKPIFISLSPNTEKEDIWLAFKLLWRPWEWKSGKKSTIAENPLNLLSEEFKKYLGVKYTFFFNSGRSAFLAILQSLDLKKNDEVLLQAFTCNAAVNPVIWSNLKPVYVDCDEKRFNIDVEDLKKKITSKSKAVIVQHTFGLPAEMDKILEICQKHNLILIEDCAHSLGASYKGKKNGTFGEVAFFSFGRDKIISSVFGGMATTNNDEIGERIKNFQKKLSFPSNFWIFQQLLHPVLTNFLVLPLYGINSTLGKILFGAFQRFSILSKAVCKKEKKGKIPKHFPKRFPNALAVLALNQFQKLEKFNTHRREIAEFYEKELKNQNFKLPLVESKEEKKPIFMRYPILINSDIDKILKEAEKRKIYLDDRWRETPIVPPDTDHKSMGYVFGNCPKAEKIVKIILNLPTHINISQKDAQKIVKFLKQFKITFNRN